MIRLSDAIVLARTKLHSKRVLLISTIIVSGILFAVLYAAVIIFSGVRSSVNNYTHEALNGKYFVKSSPVIPQSVYGPGRIAPSEGIVRELKALQADYIKQQKTIAKDKGIAFDEKSIDPILIPNPFTNEKSSNENLSLMINIQSPVYTLYLEKLQKDYVTTANNKLENLKKIGSSYDAVKYHEIIPGATSYVTMAHLRNGEENLAKLGQSEPNNRDFSTYGYMTASVRNSTYTFVNDSLVQRFILPANERREENPSAIPVIITTHEAVELFGEKLGIGQKPEKASDQLAWMTNLQKKVNGVTYTTCYRNQADIKRLTEATQVISDIKKNKDNKEFSKPTLVYDLPSEPCGNLSINNDTRTNAEKKSTIESEEKEKALGIYHQPVHQLMTFQVVGIMSVSPTSNTMSDLPSFLSQLLSAQYDAGAIIPTQSYKALPESDRYENILMKSTDTLYADILREAGISDMVVEFNSIDAARSFIKEQGCASQDGCKKPFMLTPYGVNYLLVDDLSATVTKILQISFLAIMTVAIIIIWFAMSRVIADSRRETAVFRAIGAKRIDVAAIYLLYSVAIALRIVIFAIIFGVGAAIIIQVLFSADVTNNAKVTYGVIDNIGPFTLISFDSPFLIGIALVIIAISILSVLPPLLRNVRRNPIQDMREE
jgi:hypothetical protein